MTKQIPPAERRRHPLTRERVLRAAIALADGGGIESITMRRLGEELGVEAMSLYNHVANKDDVLDGIVDAVLGEFDLPPRTADWKADVRASAVSANQVLLRHRWACRLLMSRGDLGQARMRYMNSLLAYLREAGFSAEKTHHAYHVLDSHIVGYTLQQVNYMDAAEDIKELGANFLRELPADQFPYLVEHVTGHLDGSFAGESGFEFGVDLIVDALERLRGSA